jgi:hypothetical protein
MKVVSTFALVLVLAQALTSNAAVNFYPTTPRSAPNPIQYGSANYRRASATSPVQSAAFPLGPNAQVTPGELCTAPDSRRYPERIAYCSRDVSSNLKDAIIAQYDHDFGYQIGRMQRSQFKIDHYIPLCAGGSNNAKNLWPQHVSVYTITDPLEPAICEKMSEGRLSQKDAVTLVVQAKNNLQLVPQILQHVLSL